MSITSLVCGAVADRVSNSAYKDLHELCYEQLKAIWYEDHLWSQNHFHLSRMIFDKANEFNFKEPKYN